MKNHFSNKATCPSCGGTMHRKTDPETDWSYWYCEGCGLGYADNAGTPGGTLPLTLSQMAGLVAIVRRHPELFEIKKFYEGVGKSGTFAVAQLMQAVEEEYVQSDPKTGNFSLTEVGKRVAENITATCAVCGGIVIRHDTDKTGVFWKCINCEIFFADNNYCPAKPETCPKCGGLSVTRHTAVVAPDKVFWGCGACRRIFEDNDGKIGRCSDDE